jgi:Fe-S cluster biogenesis protein NfuA
MATNLDARAFQAQMERLEAQLREAERHSDPAARQRVQEIVQAVLDLHGVGLERLLEHVAGAGAAGQVALNACAHDEVVSGLLLLHGLHPHDVPTRVRQALDSVRPALHRHGGSVELVGIEGTVVRLRLDGNCDGCPSSAATMQQTIEEAIYNKAPEITAVLLDNLAEFQETARTGRARVALPLL